MDKGKVVDIRTRKALFNESVREQLEEGITPFLKEDFSNADISRAVTTVEQVLCAALVSAAVGLATRLANAVAEKITTIQLQPPVA